MSSDVEQLGWKVGWASVPALLQKVGWASVPAQRTAVVVMMIVCAAACDADDLCEGTGTCVQVRVTSTTIAQLDVLELDVLYGDSRGTTTTTTGGRVGLPVATAITLDGVASVTVGVVAAARLDGMVVGTGFASVALEPDDHAAIVIAIAPVATPCVPGGYYCGEDKVAGDPQTLYRCASSGGGIGMAYARGACANGCLVGTGRDDACYGGGLPCVEGTNYCGGNKLDGDPRTLYQCTAAGTGTRVMECANGCDVRPGSADVCR